jgi:hypothetical protein
MGPSAEAPALYLVDDSGREHRDLAVVLVSNNPYALDRPLARGTRPTLAAGSSGSSSSTRPRQPAPPGRAWSAPRLEVSAPEPVHAGVDGEAVEPQSAAAVRYPAGGAAGPDLLAPPGRLAISAPAPARPPTPISGQEGIGAHNQQGRAPIGIRPHPENPRISTVLRQRC